MKIVITGGAGFIGARLARTLLEKGVLDDSKGQEKPIRELVIFDMVAPTGFEEDQRLKNIVGLADDRDALSLALEGADSVFHFASIVSGEAEADLALGLRVNLDGTRMLLDILAQGGRVPKLIFASSVAVYGGEGEDVDDATIATPMSSYGAQKLCCELLIGDYSRRGLIDGRSLRFPTIGVRPGKANRANSSFISNIIREPVAGNSTVCPVPEATEIALMSPAKLIDAIVKIHNMSAEEFGWPRILLLPATKVSVGQMLDALEVATSASRRELVRFEIEEEILSMIQSWPATLNARRACALGIVPNASASQIVAEYIGENT